MRAARIAVLAVAGSLVATGGTTLATEADAPPANVAVTRADLNAYQEPWLAVDPRDSTHLAVSYREGNQRRFCGLSQSRDGGRTWTSEDLIGPAGRLAWPDGFTLCYEAVIAFAPDGTLYVAVQATRGFQDPYSRILVTESTDGGVAFTPPASPDPDEPSAQGVAGGDWYPRMAVDSARGRVLLRWTRFADRNRLGSVIVTSTSGHGAGFARPVLASPAATADSFVVNSIGASIAAGSDGTVYTSWVDTTARLRGCTGGQAQVSTACAQPLPLYVAASRDGGTTFATPVAVDTELDYGCPGTAAPPAGRSACGELHYDRGPEEFSLAGGTQPGHAVLAWWGGDPQGPARISVATTSDGGRSWTPPQVVGVPPGHESDQQHRPQLSVAPGGRVDLAYYDVSPQGTQDVYVTSSDESGARFATPVRITDATSDLSVGPLGEDGVHSGYGEWLGTASTDSAEVVAWTDSRRGNRDSAKQDVYFAAVAAGTPSRSPWLYAGAAAGAALVVVAGALVWLRVRRPRRRAPRTTWPPPAQG